MVCNVLKAFFMAGMLGAVWWALENRNHLSAEVALQCFGMLLASVAGQFAFQYLVDIKMDAEGFHVFRDLRLRVGDRLKGAPMGYFSEQRLSAITTTLTTTVHQLEEFMTICLTGLSGGVAMAVIMSLFFLVFAPPVAFVTFAGIAVGLAVLEWLRRRSTSVTREITAAQENMADAVIEYARGMAVLRTFATPDDGLAAVKESFERKRRADYEQEQAAQGILKLYALVFNLASCGVLFAACALCLSGALSLSWALTLQVAAFIIYGELISANNSAFLAKKIEGELDRIDEVCAVPKQNTTDKSLATDGFDLAMEHVSFGYGDGRRVIDGVSLSIPEGSTCALVGPSGSGKSTLLHILGGVDVPTKGSVVINQTDISNLDETALAIFRRRQIGLIYQFYNLIPILTVQENLILPLLLDGRKPDEKQISTLVKRLGLENRLDHLPNQLSGGQQQRVSIGRALVNNPALMLADEPTGNLDSENSKEIISLLRQFNKDFNQTVIIITHDEKIANSADRVITIEDGKITGDEVRIG